jgi:MSHA biogenesis protein MshJ
MKQRWQRFAARIDALSLRERVLAFAAAAALIVSAAYMLALGPLFRAEQQLRSQLSQRQNNLAGMDSEINQKIKVFQRDPDAATRARLQQVKTESAQLGDSLQAMQKGLVAPERMAPLIDAILRANGRLKLVAMRTLPVASLNEAPGGNSAEQGQPDPKTERRNETEAKLASIKAALATDNPKHPAPGAAANGPAIAPKPGSLLYRHGVEITVRGNYLDMIDYMAALEALPTQLFWGGARLEVEEYPTARLTLTMYTLSLDSKWLKL